MGLNLLQPDQGWSSVCGHAGCEGDCQAAAEADDLDPGLNPLSIAALQSAFSEPRDWPQAQAALCCVFLEPGEGVDEGRILLALGDARAPLAGSSASPGLLCMALADRSREALYDAGAKPPAAALNDYPSSPRLVSQDLCSSAVALRQPAELSLERAMEALREAGSQVFAPGFHFQRHLRLSERDSGRMERQINAMIADLRAARAAARGGSV